MSHVNATHNKGFTLIEVMVAVSIFTIVVTVGIGALVTVNNAYRKTSATRQSTAAVSSAIEFVTRQLRTAQYVYCGDAFVDGVTLSSTTVRTDCVDPAASSAVSFVNQDNEQITVTTEPSSDPTRDLIVIKTQAMSNGILQGGAPSVEPLTDKAVVDIDNMYFSIEGLSTQDIIQPSVVMVVEGTVVGRTAQQFALQTTVTPRALDTSDISVTP